MLPHSPCRPASARLSAALACAEATHRHVTYRFRSAARPQRASGCALRRVAARAPATADHVGRPKAPRETLVRPLAEMRRKHVEIVAGAVGLEPGQDLILPPFPVLLG